MLDDADNIDNFDIEVPKEKDSPVDNEAVKCIESENIIPSMSDSKWSEYVLSQFEDDEVIDGNPTVDGLRRVVAKVLGPITMSESKVVQCPNFTNNNHATVEHRIEIFWRESGSWDMPPHHRVFADCADVSPDNTHPDYSVYASATAATRAEGRTLRKALQLKRIVAAEEISSIAPLESRKINAGQISFMNMVCQRMDINVVKLLNMGKQKYTKIEDIPYATSVLMNKYLSSVQRGKDDKGNVVVIREDIKGYDPDWRK